MRVVLGPFSAKSIWCRSLECRVRLPLVAALLVLMPATACDDAGFGASDASTTVDATLRDGNSPWADRVVAPPDAGWANDGADAGDDGFVDPAQFNCPEVPTAYVREYADPFTGALGDASQLLARAGFQVEPLPLDKDPRTLRGLIFFGSFVTEDPEFQTYVAQNATALYTFVDAANVLVEMTQADQTELQPPFLPNSQVARRTDVDLTTLTALDVEHPLLSGVALDSAGNLTWQAPRLGWETFGPQSGFAVLLAANQRAESPALLEGAYAQGRFILSAMALDKPEGLGPDRDAFNQAFFHNLFQYTRNVCRRQTRPVQVTAPPGTDLGKGAFTLAILPDTQYYALNYPGIFLSQVSWIAANVQRLRIPYVFHLGDIVDQNTPTEWERAAQAMWLLEGVVPYTVTTGNHDLGPSGNGTTRDTLLNHYFSYQRTAAWPTFGGAMEPGKLENSYHLFSAGGRDFIVLSLEWGPRDAVVAWADGVVAAHPTRYAILVTHAYLNYNDRRYDHLDTAFPQDFNPYQYGTVGGVNDGEELWQKLVRKHAFVMVLNGHVLGDGTGYLASVTDKGNTCHQIMSNYQFRALGGEGYMRLMEFQPDNKTIKIHTYSTLYDTFLLDPDQDFTITLDVPVGPAP